MSEPIVIPCHISNTFIREHPQWIFVFGQDHQEKGMFGQAGVAYGEPNCYMVPTCRKMCKSNRYWSDAEFDEVAVYIDEAIRRIPQDGRPIIPFPKIGMGASQMNFLAPKLFAYLTKKLDSIKYPNIIVKYNEN